MSRIEQLIAELCPDGVEWKELGEVCKILGRIGFRGYSRSDIVPYNEGAISLSPSNITNNQVNYEKCTFISWEKYQQSPEIKVEKGDIIFCKTASVGKTALIKHLPEATTINPQLALLKEIKCDNSYLSYLLISDDFQKQVNTIKGVGSIPTISQKALSTLSIPIPPLPIQQEIVRILDTFTDLDAELQAELEARKKQFEHYRNQLLNFEGKEVELKMLGEVSSYPNKRISVNGINEDNYVGVDNLLQNKQGKTTSNCVPKSGKLIAYKCNDILIGNIRPYLKKIWLATNNGGTNGDVVVIRINNDSNLLSKYLYYILSSDSFFDYNKQFAKGGKMPRGDKKQILKYKIPIPPLSEQERIVTILDKFEALVNEELPAEIAARRKQYEYYREKLLAFEPLVS